MNYEKYKGKEGGFQKAIASYLDLLGVLWFHSPNGGTRNKAEAAELKRQGVKAGVPDICILEPRGEYHGLFIEIKVGYNKASDSQIRWLGRLQDRGYESHLSYSFDETKSIIDQYLKIKD